MKKRTRIWVEYGEKYVTHDSKRIFGVQQVKNKPTRMLVITYSSDGCVVDEYGRVTEIKNPQVFSAFECDLSLHYLNWLDKYHGIFIQIPREAKR